MTARYLIGDVFERMAELPDGAYDLIVTSPPFLALRSYLPDDHPEKGKEIGSEATPAEFLDTMLALTAEWGRLLTPHGSIAIEIGDTYSGSGGAGGDYDNNGMRDGQPRFTGSAARSHPNGKRHPSGHGDGWPQAKSLCMIPELYAASLAYGRNLLTGAESPAGRWRVRNFKPWIRSNPPVGALGDKERPATSYITVATRAVDRYFDLDAVRTIGARIDETPRITESLAANPKRVTDRENIGKTTPQNPVGAPPLDWWHHVDAIIDHEIDARAGKRANARTAKGVGRQPRSGKSADRDGNWHALPELEETNGTVGARGVHIRRALETAGILTTLDAYDISPKGYSGAHYAVWPPELVQRLINEMCPHKVCTTCGQPSRRITVDRSAFDRQPELAAHIRDQRKAHGLTLRDIDGWFGLNGMAAHWESTSKQAAIPAPAWWPELSARLGLDRERFDDIVLGDRRWTESTAEYFDQSGQVTSKSDRVVGDFQGSGSAGKRDGGITAQRTTLGWSDCGHDTWRPGRILDPFVGSGTTLAVATGMARHADGIDLDPTNAELARERVGMFLEVIDQPARESA